MHVRLERSEGCLEAMPERVAVALAQQVILGPYEWVQLTYSELRVAPDGETIAHYDGSYWRVVVRDRMPFVHLNISVLDREHPFSDVIVY